MIKKTLQIRNKEVNKLQGQDQHQDQLQILTMLETFAVYITENFGRLCQVIFDFEHEGDLKYIFISLRKHLYKL